MRDGRLCYLDFGMMGHIDIRTRQALIRATLHMVNREFESLAADFVTLGMLPENSSASRSDIITALTGVPLTCVVLLR
jgi:predicted unusual protein kinase regulating ubiquinone biosynthesis (AarF/ABC1/UbiB family)